MADRKKNIFIILIMIIVVAVAATVIFFVHLGKKGINPFEQNETTGIDYESTTPTTTEELQSSEEESEEETQGNTKEQTNEQTEPETQIPDEPIISETDRIIANMTLEQKVCQMFILAPENLMDKWNITVADDEMKNRLKNYPVGGFVFFNANVVNPTQIKTMINNLQTYSNEYCGLPFFTAIDEEGGRVLRIGNNPNFPVTKVGAMGAMTTSDEAYEAGNIIGEYLKEYGFNFDFAPDADVITNSDNKVIGDRSFGNNADFVTDCAIAYSNGLHEHGVLSTFKHFPGHGATKGDTHEGFAYTDKTYNELMDEELLPFVSARENGVDAIMVAHISVPSILGDETPCTMSEYMVTQILRKELRFEGLIVTDALDMGAITQKYTDAEAAVLAIKAGNDILLKPKNFYNAYEGVINAVNNGEISEERIDESVRRIISVKLSLKK